MNEERAGGEFAGRRIKGDGVWMGSPQAQCWELLCLQAGSKGAPDRFP